MKGDFTRDTFDPKKHRLRVLQQQGRVGLDSDFNEQVSIFLHYLQDSIEDLIGPYGGPEHRCGFEVSLDDQGNDFRLGEGVYYVNGMLCQNESETLYTRQPDHEPVGLDNGKYLVYLEAWERHVTAIEDESIREVALGGADTSTRSEVVWQVKLLDFDEDLLDDDWSWRDFWEGFRRAFELAGFVRVKARRDRKRPILPDVPYRSDESVGRTQQGWERNRGRQQPSPAERAELQLDRLEKAERLLRQKRTDRQEERGNMAFRLPELRDSLLENQLYRVEIHKGGLIRSEDARKAAEAVAKAAEGEAANNNATNDSTKQAARAKADPIKAAAEAVAKAAEDEAANNNATNDSTKQAARAKAEEIKGGRNTSQEEAAAAEAVAKAAEGEAAKGTATKDTVGQASRDEAEEIKAAAEAVAKAAEDEASRRGATKDSLGREARDKAEEIKGVAGGDIPILKWAYDNASVVFPIVSLGHDDTGNAVAKLDAPNDGVRALQVDDWVEIDDRDSRGERPSLLRVRRIDRAEFAAHLIVTLAVPQGVQLDSYEQTTAGSPLLLRRWNSPGPVAIEAPDKAISLKGGFQVRFGAGRYRAGDYWSIPIRASARSEVRWSEPAPPQGISRHYAPLAVVSFDPDDRGVWLDCRYQFEPLSRVTIHPSSYSW